MSPTSWILVATLIIGVAAVATWGLGGVSAPLPLSSDPFSNPNEIQEAKAGPATSTIKLALLDTAGITSGNERGCDRVVFVPREILATSSVLNAALRELFAEEREQVSGAFNFIARTNGTLRFDYATLERGVAKVYLTGRLSGLAGVCDDPRAQTQIKETALQFPGVTRVEIYLNGKETSLTPSQQ